MHVFQFWKIHTFAHHNSHIVSYKDISIDKNNAENILDGSVKRAYIRDIFVERDNGYVVNADLTLS